MANRMICFGYKMTNGTLCVTEEEAAVVTEIFQRYGSGEVMKDIADDLTRRGVVFSPGKSVWNKPMLARILENRKYIGENNYPRVVSDAAFERANALKNQKGNKKGVYNAETTYLMDVLVCAQCGHRIYRRPNWGVREKWICPAGCKTDTYVGDMELTQEILKVLMYAKQNPDILTVGGEKTSYHPDMEVMRQTKEIHRLMDQSDIQFQMLKKLIIQCADMKFQCCSDNRGDAHTEYVQQCFAEWGADASLDVEFMKRVVDHVALNKDGTVTITLINKAEITGRRSHNAS